MRVTNSCDTIPVLAEVEPDNRAFVLEGDLKAEDLRVKAHGSVEIGHVEVDVGDIDWLDQSMRMMSLTPSGRAKAATLS